MKCRVRQEKIMKTRKMEAGEIARYVNPMMMFEENWFLVCRPFFRQQLEEKNFLDGKVAEESFPDKDFSVMHIAEIESLYEILE